MSDPLSLEPGIFASSSEIVYQLISIISDTLSFLLKLSACIHFLAIFLRTRSISDLSHISVSYNPYCCQSMADAHWDLPKHIGRGMICYKDKEKSYRAQGQGIRSHSRNRLESGT